MSLHEQLKQNQPCAINIRGGTVARWVQLFRTVLQAKGTVYLAYVPVPIPEVSSWSHTEEELDDESSPVEENPPVEDNFIVEVENEDSETTSEENSEEDSEEEENEPKEES